MTPDADLQGQLLAIFGAEASERVQAMNRHLLALEADPAGKELDEQLAGLFREAHSLKGAAGAVGMAEVEAIAHRLESVFQGVRTGVLHLQPGAFDVLYAGVDAIGSLVTAAIDGHPADVDTSARVAALEQLAESGGPEPGPSGPAAPPRPGATPHQPGPAPGPPPEPAPPGQVVGTEETVRVAVAKLDSLMNQVGELVVARIAADQQLGSCVTCSRSWPSGSWPGALPGPDAGRRTSGRWPSSWSPGRPASAGSAAGSTCWPGAARPRGAGWPRPLTSCARRSGEPGCCRSPPSSTVPAAAPRRHPGAGQGGRP